jgi:hypothetical protein
VAGPIFFGGSAQHLHVGFFFIVGLAKIPHPLLKMPGGSELVIGVSGTTMPLLFMQP